jgi:hypothetical protein
MPEMLPYCGRRFRVYKSAHKTCDTINTGRARRIADAVHLEGLRCDGKAHGGCEARCLLFWKSAWLERVPGPAEEARAAATGTATGRVNDLLQLHTTRPDGPGGAGEVAYRCQATELVRASAPLRWWDPRQYVADLATRNIRLRDLLRYGALAVYNVFMRLHWRLRPYPRIVGLAGAKTPGEALDLQAGEYVQVRPRHEVMRTLNEHGRNRGLSFDVEMVRYCGKTFRVLGRVTKLIDEKTGRMMSLSRRACLILDGAICSGLVSRNRMFCPRAIYPYWHEVWLRRVPAPETPAERDR